MTRIDLIHEIREARRAHVSWVSRAHALIDGLPLEEHHVPVHATECKFGSWYYGHGQVLSALPEFKGIVEPHLALHKTYLSILRHLFDANGTDRKGYFWAHLFGHTNEAKEEHWEEARKLFPTLKKHSETVIARLEALEQSLVRLSDEQFEVLARNETRP